MAKETSLYKFLSLQRSKRYLTYKGDSRFMDKPMKAYEVSLNLYRKGRTKIIAILSNKRCSLWSRTSIYTPIPLPIKKYRYKDNNNVSRTTFKTRTRSRRV